MKISEMTNDQAAEAMIRLAVPFGNICEDEEALKLLDEYRSMNSLPMLQTIGKMLPKLVSYMLKSHKDDLYEIIGALTFMTADKVAKMNFAETIKVIRESYDEVLASFFPLSVKQTKKTESES